ncbi:MAG: hypothetical protein A3K66_07160 [Euryarchaeota archaeon RBG_16_67_27]|nr:MAG: hypothetical protein A3K66_07160 [Euryarchaeota archaeon RBG_16_67_27]
MDDAERLKGRSDPPPIEWVRPEPPPPLSPSPAAWVPRPEDFERPVAREGPSLPRGPRSLSKAAGICMFLAGAIGIAGSVFSVLFPLSDAELANLTAGIDPATLTLIYVCGLASVYAQAFAVLGGILAFQGANWKLAVLCGFASLLTIGFVFIESSVLGGIGLLLVFLARREFVS